MYLAGNASSRYNLTVEVLTTLQLTDLREWNLISLFVSHFLEIELGSASERVSQYDDCGGRFRLYVVLLREQSD